MISGGIKNSGKLDRILKNLCITGRVKEAVGILCCTGVQVHSDTYSLVLQECIFRKEYKQGKRIHWQMVVVGFVPDEYLKIKILILYAKSGDLDSVHILFDMLLMKILIPWNTLIAGYLQKGMEEVGLRLYDKMREHGWMPDQYMFSSVFRACSSLAILEQGKQAHDILIEIAGHNGHGGLVGKGWEYFSSMMRDHGVQPGGKHHAVMIDLLGRAGRLEEAIHGNMGMVEHAVKNFFELEPKNAGKCVVLSNAYATFGLWKNVADIRRGMKGSGIKKEPGHSMIEVQKEVHFFFMGHNTHRETEQIHEMIRELSFVMKDSESQESEFLQSFRQHMDNTKEMIGTFSPRPILNQNHILMMPEETMPAGIFARGSYSAKTRFLDDDKRCYLELNYSFEIKKEWQ
ncbi:hypothetical protein OROMI_024016 [Orobanche minor]